MSSHELARKLLEMPDMPVCAEDGMDPSDPDEITRIEKTELWFYPDSVPTKTECLVLRP